MKTIICEMCWKTVKVNSHARHVKYCPECREQAKKISYARRQQEKNAKYVKSEKYEWYELETLDTPENVKICLDCRLPKCRSESTGCLRNRAKRKVG